MKILEKEESNLHHHNYIPFIVKVKSKLKKEGKKA